MRGRKPPILPLGNVVDLPSAKRRVPPPPDFLNDRAKKVWAETAKILVAKNIYDDDCEHMLAIFCTLYARFLAAEEKLQNLSLDSNEGRRYLRISNQSCNLVFRVATDLGLTVIGRLRVPKKAGRPSFLPAARDAGV